MPTLPNWSTAIFTAKAATTTDQCNMLEIKNLTIRYGAFEAVKNLTLSIGAGNTLGIAGESGSGKSTLALAIPRLLPASAEIDGTISFSGTALTSLGPTDIQRIRGAQIGMIFQEPMSALNPLMRCGEQIAETLQLHLKCSPAEARKQTLNWFERVQLSDTDRIYNAYPHELSGGQQQRVLIAMALCCNPKLLIADEPTTALDVTVQKSVLDLLKSLQAELGLTMLFISHDLGVISYMCKDIAIMHNGELVEHGPAEKVLQTPAADYTRQLMESRRALTTLPISNDMVDFADRTVIFSDDNVNVTYPAGKNFWGRPAAWIKAVDRVAVTIYEGECLGILGESGSGKSSLGREIAARAGGAKGGAVVVSQNPQASLNPRMTAGEALMEPLLVHHIVPNKKQACEKALELLHLVALEPAHFDRRPSELSGGQKQRLCLARALTIQPRLLICDEIVSALDMTIQAAILDLLKNLQQKLGLTVVFISHDLAVIRKICDRVMVMNGGKTEESGAIEKIFTFPSSDYTRSLLNSAL